MPHGYCTGCSARVTVREGTCLLGHPVDSSTIRFDSGRRISTRRTHVKKSRRTSHSAAPAPEPKPAPPPRPAVSAQETRPARPTPPAEKRKAPAAVVSTSISPTSELVAKLWHQGGESVAVENWKPQEVALDDRKARPARVIALMVAITLATGAAWWATIGRETIAASQISAVKAEGRSLEAALAGIEYIRNDMADGRVDDRTTAAMALAALDRHARSLFTAAGELPGDGSSTTRLLAVDAAQAALELESFIGDTAAYQTGFEVAASLPEFPVAAALEDVPSVAGDTAWWIAEFREAVSALPTAEGLDAHRDAGVALAAALDAWQVGYLDALAGGDPVAAESALTALETQLNALETQLAERVTAVATLAGAELTELRTSIAGLTR